MHADPELLPTEATLEFLERKGRGKPTQTVQKIDLVQSEVVRRESGNAKRGDVIFRDIPEAPNFGNVYKDIEDNAAEITFSREELQDHAVSVNRGAAPCARHGLLQGPPRQSHRRGGAGQGLRPLRTAGSSPLTDAP